MSTNQPSARRLFYAAVFSGVLLLSMGLAHRAIAQTAQQMTPAQQAAVQVVQDFFKSWDTKDPDKVASYLAPNVAFRFGPNSILCRGRAAVIARYNFEINNYGPVPSNLEAYALGGDRGVALITQRVDTINEGGKPGARRMEGHFAAFFTVINGKIAEWYENPVFLGGGFAAPRRGAPPATRRPAPTCANGLS